MLETGNEVKDQWVIRVSSAMGHLLYTILLNLNRWKLSKVEISRTSQMRTLRFKCVKHPSEIPAHGMFTPDLGVSVEIFDSETVFSGNNQG